MARLHTLKPRVAMLDTRIGRAPVKAGMTANQRYDAQRARDSATRALYGTARWKRLSLHQRAVEPLCRMCMAEDGRPVPATHCDHIEPHRGDVEKFWAGPFQSLCTHHHNSVKQREERAEYAASRPWSGEVVERRMPSDLLPSRIPLTIVCGPPGSGKSTYIRERIGPRDILIDLDRIMGELSGLPEHHTSTQWLVPALEERNRLLHSLADDREHDRAWFIVGAPDPDERQKWADKLHGELVTLAVPLDECKSRIEADASREGHRPRMLRAAEDWWRRNLHLSEG